MTVSLLCSIPQTCTRIPSKAQSAAQRHAAKVGRWVMSELKRLEKQIVDAGLMPDD